MATPRQSGRLKNCWAFGARVGEREDENRNLQGGRNVLHITRREWESVHVSGEADILVRRIGRGRVELSIAAPAETRIVRSDAKRREPKPALTTERENG